MNTFLKFLLIACAGFILTLLISYIPLESGFFHQAIPCVVFLIISVLIAFISRLWRPWDSGILSPWEFFILASVCLVAASFYFPGSEYILGGWDPGVYLASGVSIVKNGVINFADGLLQKLNSEERNLFLSRGFGLYEFYPGFRLLNPPDGSILSPQFVHMYPALLAWTFSLFGIKFCFSLNSALALGSVIAVYVLSRCMVERKAALLAAAFLALNPLQIWMARFQNSEILTQLCFVLGFAFLFLGSKTFSSQNRVWSYFTHILSGVCFWICLLARYDSIVSIAIILSLGILNIAWIAFSSPAAGPRLAWAFTLFLGLFHAFIHEAFIASLYAPLGRLIKPFLILTIVSSLILGLGIFLFKNKLEKLSAYHSRLRWAACVIFLASLFYAIFIRARDFSLGYDRLNILHLAVMASWPVMLFALLAIIYSLFKIRTFPEMAFLAAGLAISIAVVHRKYIDPFYLWAGRRFIPVVFPFLMILAAKGIERFGGLFKNSNTKPLRVFDSSTLFYVFIFSVFLLTTQPQRSELTGYRDYQGITETFESMAKKIPEADLIITQERGIAEVLHLIYGLPALYLRNADDNKMNQLKEILIRRLKSGSKVLILTQNKSPYERFEGLHLKTINRFSWHGYCLSSSKAGFPSGLQERGLNLFLLQPELKESSS
jgi:hypothetical protein